MTDRQDGDTYHDYSVDSEDQPQVEEGVAPPGDPALSDPLDEGWTPPEKWSAAERFGTTAAEESTGESLDQLLAEEEPEPDPYAEAADADIEDDRLN
jgi:hypothetical protein